MAIQLYSRTLQLSNLQAATSQLRYLVALLAGPISLACSARSGMRALDIRYSSGEALSGPVLVETRHRRLDFGGGRLERRINSKGSAI